MAAIDLKSTTIFIQDGSTSALAGTITAALGIPAAKPRDGKSTTTLVVTGFTGVVAVGQLLTIADHLQYYSIIAHTETTAHTTGITVFPAVVDAIVDADPVTVIGNGIYAKIGDGNLTYNEKRNLTYIRDRGFIDTVKLGDDEPLDVSLDFTWEFLRGTSLTPPTIEEAIKGIGLASTWTSSSIDPCEPYCVEIIVLDIPPCGTETEKINISQFRWETMDHDLKGAKVAVKGTCNIATANVTHASVGG